MKKSGIFIILLLLIAVLAVNSIFTVRENEYACTVRFAKIIDTSGEDVENPLVFGGDAKNAHREYASAKPAYSFS